MGGFKFKEIIIYLEEEFSIEIQKNIKKKQKQISFIFYKNKEKIDTINYSDEEGKVILEYIKRFSPFREVDAGNWMDPSTREFLTSEELIAKYADTVLSEYLDENPFKIKSKAVNDILDSINVHLIQEQRLFKRVSFTEKNYRRDKGQTLMTETIKTYANDLRKLTTLNVLESYSISQKLDSSYPIRLITEKEIISKEKYDERFNKLIKKQEKLARYGLYEKKQETLDYSEEDGKALLVYLGDFEKKLSVFDKLLEKLDLFTNILNERRFTFKSIYIHKEKGFFFKTNKGKDLSLTQLSSGEQHEVILLYELIFNTQANTLVLIDEPEISLHITWQKEFLNDLLKIIQIQQFQVLIATHSPSIINDRWDLVHTLKKEHIDGKKRYHVSGKTKRITA